MHDAPGQPAGAPMQMLTNRMRDLQEGNAATDKIVVEELVTAVLDTMDGRLTPLEAVLLREVGGLGRIIEQTRAAIADVSVDDVMDSHIPSATDELGAIVEHTAVATDSILESCEMLDRLALTLGAADSAVLRNATTQIYEACSFQDITGQRITKVVKALQAIEARVATASRAFGHLAPPSGQETPRKQVAAADPLLNGPMLPHNAMGQDEIDKLLADFG